MKNKKIKETDFRCMLCQGVYPSKSGLLFQVNKDAAIKICFMCNDVIETLDGIKKYYFKAPKKSR